MRRAPHRRRQTAEEPRDAGMTLAELVVTIGLMGLIGTMVAAVAIVTLRTTAGLQDRLDDAAQNELGLANVSKVLRTAVLPEQLDEYEDQACVGCADRAVYSATSTTVTFYSNLANSAIGPSMVTLRVAEDAAHPGTAVLWEDTLPPKAGANGSYSFCTVGTSGCAVRKRVIARGLVWPSPGVFTYYDFNGAALPFTTGSNPKLADTNLPRVQSVDVVLKVRNDDSLGAPVRTAVTRVRLPNVEISINNDGIQS